MYPQNELIAKVREITSNFILKGDNILEQLFFNLLEWYCSMFNLLNGVILSFMVSVWDSGVLTVHIERGNCRLLYRLMSYSAVIS
jgi:hypothetical protein